MFGDSERDYPQHLRAPFSPDSGGKPYLRSIVHELKAGRDPSVGKRIRAYGDSTSVNTSEFSMENMPTQQSPAAQCEQTANLARKRPPVLLASTIDSL
jgi:hypothetical protein